MIKEKKKIIIFLCLLFYLYFSAILNIPSNITKYENDDLKIKTVFGLKLSELNSSIFTSSDIGISDSNLKVSLFGIPIKNISVKEIENKEVTLLGKIIGIKLYTKGVLVVGMTEIYDENNNPCKPFEKSGIKEGDSIIRINEKEIDTIDDLIKSINNSKGEQLKMIYLHNTEEIETIITPVKVENNLYKIGLWVREDAAGIGTATFYDEETKQIAILGHGIIDVDTGEIIDISSGEITDTKILNIQKGKNNEIGKIQGTLVENKILGKIYKNSYNGIFGKVMESYSDFKKYPRIKIAPRDDIQEGEAYLLCSLDNENEINQYKIAIEKVYYNNNSNNKSMLIRITDEELLKKTGGIVQGMSGSPIVQNGKLIGALTHVLVQDPKRGYAVFADLMLEEMK